jgi:hypothetical protein
MNVILFVLSAFQQNPGQLFPEAVFCGSGLVSSALVFGLLTWAGKIVRETSSQVGFIVAMSARNYSSLCGATEWCNPRTVKLQLEFSCEQNTN